MTRNNKNTLNDSPPFTRWDTHDAPSEQRRQSPSHNGELILEIVHLYLLQWLYVAQRLSANLIVRLWASGLRKPRTN